MLAADGRSIVRPRVAAGDQGWAVVPSPDGPPAPPAPRPPAYPFYQPHQRGQANLLAIVSLAFGIPAVAIMFFGWFLILISPWTAVVPMVLGAVATATGVPGTRPAVGRGKAMTGLVMGIAGMILPAALLAMRFILTNDV